MAINLPAVLNDFVILKIKTIAIITCVVFLCMLLLQMNYIFVHHIVYYILRSRRASATGFRILFVVCSREDLDCLGIMKRRPNTTKIQTL